MVWFKCFHCPQRFETFEIIIRHLTENHPNCEIKLIRIDTDKSTTINFKIIPEACRQQGRTITIKNNEEKVHISRPNLATKDSPCTKLFKDDGINQSHEGEHDNIECPTEDTEEPEFKELVDLLPGVIEEMKKIGKVDEYVSFHRLVSEGRFPLNNIAFLLFLDVVRWFSLEMSTTSMRYSNELKLFWRTGLRLFHGRFLRFMGGPKCTGNIVANIESHGLTYAKNSNVNFIVPDRKVLQDEKRFVKGNSPGILHEMIKTMADCDPSQLKTYKLCVDGKKINPTSKGEVQLWGYEDAPTFFQKESRFRDESEFLHQLKDTLSKLISFGHTEIATCAEDDKTSILDDCRKIVTIISERLKDLRQLKVKKDQFLIKMMEKCLTDWRSSQFAMVISSIKTSVYRIENAISDLLSLNESLCRHAAYIGNASAFLCQSKQIPMISQENLVCLGEGGSSDCPPLLKQRSEGWHALRNKSIVTGSKVNTALGLDGLKKQKEYIETQTGKRPNVDVSPELQEKFDYGTENEVNAIATAVGIFLPAFFPQSSFVEEGCYTVEKDERLQMVVSPDGSIRNIKDMSRVLCGVEIKCPFPGKLYTTPIHYGIPHYYVCQVLSEMFALEVDKLLFISYSKDSTAIHNISFDQNLWLDIFEEIKHINMDSVPKKSNPSVPTLRTRIAHFCKSNVKLLAEVPSYSAISCSHESSSRGRIFHEKRVFDKSSKPQLQDLLKVLMKSEEVIRDCHLLCAQRASEVLVFLISDLDRTYKAAIPHAFPIAFALKGYSMKTDIMRKMLQDVLTALFLRGIYTPVVSYDGQWAKLALTNEDGEPLTILELQKKVFAEVQRKSSKDLCDNIFQTGVVKVATYEDATRELHVEKKGSCITVGLKGNEKQFTMSSNAIAYMHSCSKQNKRDKPNEHSGENVDEILSSIPTEELAKFNEDVVQALSSIDRLASTVHEAETDQVVDIILNRENSSVPIIVDDNSLAAYESPTIHEHLDPDIHSETDYLDMEPSQTSEINIISIETMEQMLKAIKTKDEWHSKWIHKSLDEFKDILSNKDQLIKNMTKSELLFCYDVYANIHGRTQLRICKSWAKGKIADTLFEACTSSHLSVIPTRQKRKSNPPSLSSLCKKVVKSLPKKVLNVVVAEHEFPEKVHLWQQESPFHLETPVMAYVFSILDVHHLHTNCRIKVCKDGFPDRGISKKAWLAVAEENKTNLKIPHVQDLIDKQSDAIAKLTFSEDVETAMNRLNYKKEAHFCHLLREYQAAEDDPGISALERCRMRLNLRQWLLDGVNFNAFPPYGSHIKGIPNIMFQGYLTNIERRMQIYPYVKSGCYNVRSFESLEAENFFSEFQDLDPKGSGVIKAEEIPAALEAACQMNYTRVMPERPFHMNLTKAKVYPTKALLDDSEMDVDQYYFYPGSISKISIRDHIFDHISRGKRKARRKIAIIAEPDAAAKGVAPVRQHHKCDQSKILPHKRLGIKLE